MKQAVREMHNQVGNLEIDDQGIARKGLLVRHLLMPGMKEESRGILQFLAKDNFHGECSRVAVAVVGPEDSNNNQFSSIKKLFKN